MEESHIVLLKNFVSKINIEAETAYDELYRVFTHEFDMPIIFVPFKRESICFRSRNNSDGKDYCNFSDLSYPAKEYLTKYSRANKPGQQVFYCSDNYGTSLTELLPFWSKDMEVGDLITVTVSQWNFNKEFYAAAIPDFTNNRLMSLLENNLPSLKSDNVFKKYWGYIKYLFSYSRFLSTKYL